MYTKMDKIKIAAIIGFAVEILLLVIFKAILKMNIEFLAYIFLFVSIVLVVAFLYVYYLERKQRIILISNLVKKEESLAFEAGKVGYLIYDDDNNIIYTSENLEEDFNCIGEKLTRLVEGTKPLFKDNLLNVTAPYNNKMYEFTRSEDEPVIIVKDITDFYNLTQRYNNEGLVLGLVNFDNYAETVAIEDESKIAEINAKIRQRVVSWVNEHGGIVRRIRSDRFFIVCTEENFKTMSDAKFDILDIVKKVSEKLDVAITASMAFAHGNEDVIDQDNTINSLMELVLSRGGDQVAIKPYGKDIQFYGTSSETSEKTSRVKARVIAQGLTGLIEDSSKIFIIPHTESDLDALGAALGMDNIVKTDSIPSYIVFDGINVEPKTKEIYLQHLEELKENHNFISLEGACDLADENSLMVVVDHHTFDLSSAPELIKKSNKIIIIDHHRRKTEDNIPAIMIYNEPSSSSTVELVTELIQYQKDEPEISYIDLTVMYAGLLVDTDSLKVRATSRTFEACSSLKKLGADTAQANEWLKESLDDVINKDYVVRNMEVIEENIIISCVDENIHLSRTALSQAADYLLGIKNIDAVFVIGKLDSEITAISARSTNKINVQLILEKLGGGGHFNAAGLQKTGVSILTMKQALIEQINEYKNGGKTDESNTTI